MAVSEQMYYRMVTQKIEGRANVIFRLIYIYIYIYLYIYIYIYIYIYVSFYGGGVCYTLLRCAVFSTTSLLKSR